MRRNVIEKRNMDATQEYEENKRNIIQKRRLLRTFYYYSSSSLADF